MSALHKIRIVLMSFFVWSFLWGIHSYAAHKELFDPAMQEHVAQKLSSVPVQEVLKATAESNNQIHFFWTSGFQYEWLEERYNPNKSVEIGGSQWAPLFFPTLKAFLEHTPENKSIKLVVDRLTFESNAQEISALEESFPTRFQIIEWEALRLRIKEMAQRLRPNTDIDPYLNQATSGNPAVSSDLYRLVGMPLSIPDFNDTFTFTYSDVDTFLNGLTYLEDELSAQFLKAILTPPISNSCCQKKKDPFTSTAANDVIKIRYKSMEHFEQGIVSKTLNRLQDMHVSEKEHLASLYRLMNRYVLPNNFSDYIQESKDEAIYNKPYVMNILGPDPAKSLTDFNIEPYKAVSTFAWDLTKILQQASGDFLHISPYLIGHVPQNDRSRFSSFQSLLETRHDFRDDYLRLFPDEEEKETYERHVEVALLTRRLGMNHPFNHQLHQWLKDNNPYGREFHKDLLRTRFPEKETKDILREGLLKFKPFYASAYLRHHQSYFFALWYLFDKIGIEFDTGLAS